MTGEKSVECDQERTVTKIQSQVAQSTIQNQNQNQNELYCQVCLHIRGICFNDRSSTVQQNDSDKTRLR